MMRASVGRPERRDRAGSGRARRGGAGRRGSAAASGPSGSRPRSSARRRARSSTEASRKILRSASGRTTVPMSRPAMTIPPVCGQGALAREQRRPQLRRRRETAETAASTAGLRTSSVTSTPSTRTRDSRPLVVGGELDLVDERARARSGSSDLDAAMLGAARSPPGRAGRCRRSGSRARAPRRRRRCSCPTSRARRGRRRAGASDRGASIAAGIAARIAARLARPGRRRRSVAGRRPRRRHRPRPRTSGAFSGRTRPLRRPSIRTGPIRTRTSRSIGAPTAPNIRRSWRFQPCASVARYQARSAAAAGARSVDEPVGLDAGHRPQADERRRAPRRARCPPRRARHLVARRAARADRARIRARRRSADGGPARTSRRRW